MTRLDSQGPTLVLSFSSLLAPLSLSLSDRDDKMTATATTTSAIRIAARSRRIQGSALLKCCPGEQIDPCIPLLSTSMHSIQREQASKQASGTVEFRSIALYCITNHSSARPCAVAASLSPGSNLVHCLAPCLPLFQLSIQLELALLTLLRYSANLILPISTPPQHAYASALCSLLSADT